MKWTGHGYREMKRWQRFDRWFKRVTRRLQTAIIIGAVAVAALLALVVRG